MFQLFIVAFSSADTPTNRGQNAGGLQTKAKAFVTGNTKYAAGF